MSEGMFVSKKSGSTWFSDKHDQCIACEAQLAVEGIVVW